MENETKSDDEIQQPGTTTQNKSNGELEDLILDVAWKDYSSSMEEKRMLDTKANMILVASGVLLGLVINGIKIMNFYLAILALCTLVISSIFCIKALSLRTYGSLGAMKTWTAIKSDEKSRNDIIIAKRDVMATIDSVVEENRKQAKNIGDLIKPANQLFIGSLAIITLSVILYFLPLLCGCNRMH